LRVAVLKGGSSFERAVSLRSAARVEDAIAANGWEAVPIDVGPELVSTLISAKPDAAFIALHGPGGEDGTPQELLEILGIPHTGPGVAACIRCMDKVIAKHELRGAGVPTPDWVAFSDVAFRTMGAADALGPIEERLGFPLIVKPAGQGSSLGVKLVPDAAAIPSALLAALSYDDRVLLERYVEGRELAVSILDGNPLPIVEIRPPGVRHLQLRGSVRDRANGLRLPSRAERGRGGCRQRRLAADLGGSRPVGLRTGGPDPRRRGARGPGGQHHPWPDRYEPAADGCRSSRHQLRGVRAARRRARPRPLSYAVMTTGPLNQKRNASTRYAAEKPIVSGAIASISLTRAKSWVAISGRIQRARPSGRA
jgi:hypothetical protein